MLENRERVSDLLFTSSYAKGEDQILDILKYIHCICLPSYIDHLVDPRWFVRNF